MDVAGKMLQMSFRRFTTIVVCGVVMIFSLVATSFQIWHEYRSETQSRAQYQKVIFELFQTSLREPLIQGSFVETKDRAEKLSHVPNIACLGLVAENQNLLKCDDNIINKAHALVLRAPIPFGEGSSANVAQLTVVFDNSDLFQQILIRSAEAVLANLALAGLIFLLFSWALKTIQRELELLIETADDTSSFAKSSKSLRIREFSYLAERIRAIFVRIKENAETAVIAELATSLAHDIRSPLARLSVVTDDLPETEEETRSRVRNAVSDINDIANSLLLRVAHGADRRLPAMGSNSVESHQMMNLVDQVISEKRIQYRKLENIKIEFRAKAADYSLFARFEASDFKRVVSNLVNNAVEAIGDRTGFITAELEASDKQLIVKITDDGPGIPADILQELFVKRITTKESGQGLGLVPARLRAQAWGGDITVKSSSSGTVVVIQIPRSKAPEWFVPKISIPAGCEVVVLDDDPGIHQIWSMRLKKLMATGEIDLRKFTKGTDFVKWVESSNTINRLYFIDFELIGQRVTGLDLIEKLNIEGQSILVTSRHDEADVRSRAEHLGVQILSKMLAGFVPIDMADVESSNCKDLVRGG